VNAVGFSKGYKRKVTEDWLYLYEIKRGFVSRFRIHSKGRYFQVDNKDLVRKGYKRN